MRNKRRNATQGKADAMNSENIIGINVANGVSILVMGAFGGLLLAAARHFISGGGKATLASGPRVPGT